MKPKKSNKLPSFFFGELRDNYFKAAKKRYTKLGHEEYKKRLFQFWSYFLGNNTLFAVIPEAVLARGKNAKIEDISNCIFNRGYIDACLMGFFFDPEEPMFSDFDVSMTAFIEANNVVPLLEWIKSEVLDGE